MGQWFFWVEKKRTATKSKLHHRHPLTFGSACFVGHMHAAPSAETAPKRPLFITMEGASEWSWGFLTTNCWHVCMQAVSVGLVLCAMAGREHLAVSILESRFKPDGDWDDLRKCVYPATVSDAAGDFTLAGVAHVLLQSAEAVDADDDIVQELAQVCWFLFASLRTLCTSGSFLMVCFLRLHAWQRNHPAAVAALGTGGVEARAHSVGLCLIACALTTSVALDMDVCGAFGDKCPLVPDKGMDAGRSFARPMDACQMHWNRLQVATDEWLALARDACVASVVRGFVDVAFATVCLRLCCKDPAVPERVEYLCVKDLQGQAPLLANILAALAQDVLSSEAASFFATQEALQSARMVALRLSWVLAVALGSCGDTCVREDADLYVLPLSLAAAVGAWKGAGRMEAREDSATKWAIAIFGLYFIGGIVDAVMDEVDVHALAVACGALVTSQFEDTQYMHSRDLAGDVTLLGAVNAKLATALLDDKATVDVTRASVFSVVDTHVTVLSTLLRGARCHPMLGTVLEVRAVCCL